MKIIKYNKQGSATTTATEQAVAASPSLDGMTALSNVIKVQYDEHGNATLVIDGALCTTGDVTQNYEIDEPVEE